MADRILEMTGAISLREKKDQFLDKMELERERGITIKAQSVRLQYKAKDGQTYQLNLIDTPGHVDFHYEVSRSLNACEGAVLVIDASQGVEAQTVANAYMAIDCGLEIIPVFNKIDLPNADPERVKKEVEEILGIPCGDAVCISAKTGQGVGDLLEQIVALVPPPKENVQDPLRALLFDSWFDSYQGVVCLIRVKDGRVSPGMKVQFMSTGKQYDVIKVGSFSPYPKEEASLSAGEVGFFTAAIKDLHETSIGDTLTSAENPATKALPGFKEVKPMVFAGIFPIDSDAYESLKVALEKLRLNDASFTYLPESSKALGFGFRCGFLGLLHMEIIRERLEREYNLELISTAPMVLFKVKTTKGEWLELENPSDMPSPEEIEEIQEPYILAHVHLPSSMVGALIALCEERRGIQRKIEYLASDRILLVYELPFSEMMFDFFDKLKSLSKGYASFDYEFLDWRPSDLIRLNVLVNGEPVDALSVVLHREKSYYRGREIVKKLREVIPRQMYDVALQAAIGNKILARETVKALRKNVTAKCYGGDITRKRKLLEKQKEGKKRMKQVGNVAIPQEAFLTVLKVD